MEGTWPANRLIARREGTKEECLPSSSTSHQRPSSSASGGGFSRGSMQSHGLKVWNTPAPVPQPSLPAPLYTHTYTHCIYGAQKNAAKEMPQGLHLGGQYITHPHTHPYTHGWGTGDHPLTIITLIKEKSKRARIPSILKTGPSGTFLEYGRSSRRGCCPHSIKADKDSFLSYCDFIQLFPAIRFVFSLLISDVIRIQTINCSMPFLPFTFNITISWLEKTERRNKNLLET